MIIERRKNAIRNVTSGITLRILELGFPFLMRTVIIHFLGLEYAGLNGLFTSILQVLNMTELGVGSAMVYSMYQPVAEDDAERICALMNLYKKYYRVIGLVVGLLGLFLLPFLPKLVKDGIPPDLNVYVLYLLYLSSTVLSYWLFAYKNAVLSAHQRHDIISKVRLAVLLVQYTIQVVSVVWFRNYYVFLIVALVGQILINIATAAATHKLYPEYKAEGKLEKTVISQINSRISALFVVKLSNVIVSNVGTLVISAFLGLTMLAIYQNYFTIITAVTGTVSIIYTAALAGIGNSIVVESKEKNLRDFYKLMFIISWIAGFCACCFLCLFQPFITVWVGAECLMGIESVVCLCVYFYLYEMSRMLDTYKDAAGIWQKDRVRLLVTSVTSLVLNLILVRVWGIVGVVLSTVFSMLFVGIPWLIRNLFDEIFDKKEIGKCICQMLVYAFITVAIAGITYGICSWIPAEGWEAILLRGIVCCIVPNVLYLLLFRKKEEFGYCRSVLAKELMRFVKK